MSFLENLPITPPSKAPVTAIGIKPSVSLASTVLLPASESSGLEDYPSPWTAQKAQTERKASFSAAALLGLTNSSTPEQSCIQPISKALPTPPPLIPLFPGVTTPTSAPFFTTRVRHSLNGKATFFDVFAPEIDTPSPIRLTRQLSFPSLPSLPVTSMSFTMHLPQVVLEEDESDKQTPKPRQARRFSDCDPRVASSLAPAGATRRPLGSPISLFKSENGSDASVDESGLKVPPSDGHRQSTCSVHTFGHTASHSASMQVLYNPSPTTAISRPDTPITSSECDRDQRGERPGSSASSQPASFALHPSMVRSPDDSPAYDGERPRRRTGSASRRPSGPTQHCLFVHHGASQSASQSHRPYPTAEELRRNRKRSTQGAQSAVAKDRSATPTSDYADVSDYDALSPMSAQTVASPLYAKVDIVVTGKASVSSSPGEDEAGNTNRLGFVRRDLHGTGIVPRGPNHPLNHGRTPLLPRRSTSRMIDTASPTAVQGRSPPIPARMSSQPVIFAPSPPHQSLTAALSMPIPRIAVESSTPHVQQSGFDALTSSQRLAEYSSNSLFSRSQQHSHNVERALLTPSPSPPSTKQRLADVESPRMGRSASFLSMLKSGDSKKAKAFSEKNERNGKVEERRPSIHDDLPMAVISRQNNLMLDAEEASAWIDQEVLQDLQKSDAGRVSDIYATPQRPSRHHVSITEALAMGPDQAYPQESFPDRSAGRTKTWTKLPAALRSVRSLASFTSHPKLARSRKFSKNVPLPTPPHEERGQRAKTNSNGSRNDSQGKRGPNPPPVSYDLMLGVAGALLAMQDPRQRTQSLTQKHGKGQQQGHSYSNQHERRPLSPASTESDDTVEEMTSPSVGSASEPQTPAAEDHAVIPDARSSQLGPAFATPSPASAVRDVAWAGRPELISDDSNETPPELRRAFWNDEDETSRFKRVTPASPTSTVSTAPSPAKSSMRTPSTTDNSMRRFERDQYAWLRMQEASPTLPACDLPRSSGLGAAISTIPFPRASPASTASGASRRMAVGRFESGQTVRPAGGGASLARKRVERQFEVSPASSNSFPLCQTPSPTSGHRPPASLNLVLTPKTPQQSCQSVSGGLEFDPIGAAGFNPLAWLQSPAQTAWPGQSFPLRA
ncbi:hypothetical protein OC861_001551 [Tilletia horrida]|nr:hypothetical protein OC861_001551 [Tilletia horrida]